MSRRRASIVALSRLLAIATLSASAAASDARADEAITAEPATAAAESVSPASLAVAALPIPRSDEDAAALDAAFLELLAEDEAVWRPAETRITELWSRSGSPSADLLLSRGHKAMEREDWLAAIEHLSDLVELAPWFAEGWNARATAYYRADDYGASLADVAEALALEPRHFGALSGLGLLLEEIGDEAGALAAFRAALEAHPHLEGPIEAVKRLTPKVDGRDA